MVFKRKGLKWFGGLLVFFIIFGLSSVLCLENVNAVSLGYDYFSFNYNTPWNQSFVYSGHKGYDSATFNIHAIQRIAASSVSVGSVPSNANYMSVTAKFNLLTWTDNGSFGYLPSSGSEVPHISDVAINGVAVPFESSNLNIYITDFVCQPLNAGISTNCRTFTYEFTFVVKNVSGTINSVAFAALYDGNLSLFSGFRDGFNCYFEYDPNNKVIIDFSYDYTSALLQQQTQLQSITNNNLNQINNTVNDYFSSENSSVSNIENQSTSDIPNTEMNSTTSGFFSIISAFLNRLSTIRASNTCELTLAFPSFAGGTQVVDPCNGKQIAPSMVTLFSNLTAICFFVPFAFIMLRMIYNEIRSYTNG